MSQKRNKYLDYLVYLIVRIVICIVQSLTLETGYSIARLIAWLGWTFDKRHRKVAITNLEKAFGDHYTPKQREQIVYGVYDHFARVIIEMAWIPRKVRITNYSRFASLAIEPQAMRALLDCDRGKIVLTGHFGNWEMAGFLFAALGVHGNAIARRLDNPYLHDFLLRFRSWSGQKILDKNADYEKIEQTLVEKDVLISVADQSAGEKGLFVDFFGQKSSTHKSIALLAERYDAPIVVGYAFRNQPGFHYEAGCSTVIDPRDYADQPGSTMRITQDFTSKLEAIIRKAPEQYLWLHNRWKHQPPAKKKKQSAEVSPAMSIESPRQAA